MASCPSSVFVVVPVVVVTVVGVPVVGATVLVVPTTRETDAGSLADYERRCQFST